MTDVENKTEEYEQPKNDEIESNSEGQDESNEITESSQPEVSENSEEETEKNVEVSQEERPAVKGGRNRKLRRQVQDLQLVNEELLDRLSNIEANLGSNSPTEVNQPQNQPTYSNAPADNSAQREYRINKADFMDDLKELVKTTPEAKEMLIDPHHPVNKFEQAVIDSLIMEGETPKHIYDVAKAFPTEIENSVINGYSPKQKYDMYHVLRNRMKKNSKKVEMANRIKNAPKPTGTIAGSSSGSKTNNVADLVADFRRKAAGKK